MIKQPNILLLLVDEERYPPPYENAEIRAWRQYNLLAQQWLRENGLEFHSHYIGSAACAPSRTTLFTGHYPSLHGVTQTDGIAKQAADSDMYWLDRNTVPTMGDYFREAGYETYYRGKWHLSNEDIMIPGTQNGLPSYDPVTGIPNADQRLYEEADRLEAYGFSGWIGPEPHGRNPRNSGSSAGFGASGRDEYYADEVVRLIGELDRRRNRKPWLITASIVNPHDIVLYGDLTTRLPQFRFDVDPSIPEVSPPPTLHENLQTKPRCQASYRDLYPVALQPITNHSYYRRLYYQLQKNADQQLQKILEAITHTSCFEDTIIIFTSDHGDLLGAHGGLHQKMYCAYEEMLHVPLVIYNKKLIPQARSISGMTSHLDLLPTLLGLANIPVDDVRSRLQGRFSEARPLVGRNLAPVVRNPDAPFPDSPIYFMTDDDMLRGQHQTGPLGNPYPPAAQPNHIEAVIITLPRNGRNERWKLSRYADDPKFWSTPGVQDVTYWPTHPAHNPAEIAWAPRVKTIPVPDEYELYCLTDDPLETRNLAQAAYSSAYADVLASMMSVLAEQRARKRLTPGRTRSYKI
ncbi:arylsulfatase A-like enzyme [Paenibacillus cellulosilyticus]|uniref:Arylsulfatase A-like enzyme n=1 Tax=Paenibacillus cellulosilyticus TaxID=375489 RepID=A0A2V2Z4C4_9BACL|nr:sulfatase-like hydrolase/transferase [Paenibacillus cellulosilyticus]PWW08660.1 arylsulfatase A-like enzyme [Paenibacillus cellulosilyticus]QKS48224.1 sulfatase-like hydrolase/transferase [Paenibacillus cellulosilyticus]